MQNFESYQKKAEGRVFALPQNSKERWHAFLPTLNAALGHIIWGFSVLFTKMALQIADPDVLLSIRFSLAAIFMTVLIMFGRAHVSFKGKKLRPLILLILTELPYYYLESYGILYTNATFASAVLSIVPVVAIILAILFLKEYPTRRQAVFCIFPVVGVIIMTVSGSSLGIVQPIGVILLVLCCLSSATYKTANRKSAEEFTPFERSYAIMVTTSVVFTALAFWKLNGDFRAYFAPLSQISFVVPVLVLSVFCSVGANLLVNDAAGKMPVVKLSSFGALTTLCSMFAGTLFLKEPLTASMLVGALLILIGIYQVTRK